MKTYMSGIIASLFVFITPVIPLIWLVLLFVISDTALGVWASYKENKQIKSRKLARVISKITIYCAMIMMVYSLDVLVLYTWIDDKMLVTKIGAGVLCFVEGFSMDENIRRFNNDKGVIFYVERLFKVVKGVKVKYNELVNGKD
jgi:preprotein translocase subunit SecG